MNTATPVQKLRNYCNVLRDDGIPIVVAAEAVHRVSKPGG
jgi:hypothetical protein